jgi:hypothetical protein
MADEVAHGRHRGSCQATWLMAGEVAHGWRHGSWEAIWLMGGDVAHGGKVAHERQGGSMAYHLTVMQQSRVGIRSLSSQTTPNFVLSGMAQYRCLVCEGWYAVEECKYIKF